MTATIELNRYQYRELIRAMQTAGSVYGILGGMVSEEYKERSAVLDSLETHLLERAEKFDSTDMCEIYQGRIVATDDLINDAADDLLEYEEYSFWEVLANKLTKKEMAGRYTKEEAMKMTEEDWRDVFWQLLGEYLALLEKKGLDCLQVIK